MNTRTIYIVDDNTEFRESTRFWLSGAGFEVKAWGDPHEAIEALARRDRSEPACLMLDLRMPQLSGLDVHDALLERGAQLPVIYMSGHADVPLAVQAMQKGALTLLEKPFDDGALEAALESAFAGTDRRTSAPAAVVARDMRAIPVAIPATPVAADVPAASVARDVPATPAAREALSTGSTERQQAHARFVEREATLTPREREVLGYVILGVYNKNIADRIGLSIKTVELYRARGMAKMQARSVAELTRMMVTHQV